MHRQPEAESTDRPEERAANAHAGFATMVDSTAARRGADRITIRKPDAKKPPHAN